MYEIRELKTGEMLTIIDLASTEPKKFQLEMVKRAVYHNGVALGEQALELPFGEYMKLAVEVMNKHNFGGEEEKKD